MTYPEAGALRAFSTLLPLNNLEQTVGTERLNEWMDRV